MKLEIESNSSSVMGLVAKTAQIFSMCDGYHGKKCHVCRYAYAKNTVGPEMDGCRIEDLKEVIEKFEL